MKLLKFIIVVGLFFTGCTPDNELTIVFPRGDGLSRDSRVLLNGLAVGGVKSIKLGQTYEIEATVTLDDEVKISNDSKFILVKGLFGTGTIDINGGSSSEYFVSGQKVNGQIEEAAESDDGFGGLVKKFLKDHTDSDSVLIELRRLNNNLERLMKKPE